MTSESGSGAAAAQAKMEDGAGKREGPGWLAALRARLGLTGPPTLRATLEAALQREATTADAFSPVERDMMLRLLRFGALRVDDVMVPRADIIAADEQQSLADLVRTFQAAGVSRIPIYRESLDDPRGMVHIKDVVQYLAADALAASLPSQAPKRPASATPTRPEPRPPELSRSIATAKILRPVLYVPPSMPAMSLLIRMQSTRIHMAVVIDEYGGTDGLVTIEDLVEQVVGDIEDEHDVEEAANIVEDADGVLIAAARTPIQEIEARLGLKLLEPEDEADFDTLGGLISALTGRVPGRGELVRHPSGIEFEVLEADPRRVKKLKVHRAPAGDATTPRQDKAP